MASLQPVAEETKAEHAVARNVHPFEMEEGRRAGKPDPDEQRTTYRKHCSKFACCGVFLSLVLILGILTAVFYPKKPQVSLFESSLLEIDGFTGKLDREERLLWLRGCYEMRKRGRYCLFLRSLPFRNTHQNTHHPSFSPTPIHQPNNRRHCQLRHQD